jgi:signal transduction histidine kinase
MSRVNTWVWLRRRLRSIGADLSWTMFGLVLFTVIAAMVVLGYSFFLYFDNLINYSAEILVKRYKIPDEALDRLVEEASLRAEKTLTFDFLSLSERILLLTLVILTFLLPTLLAWWLSRRFARPLTDLSKAAHLITTGDFSARVKLSPSLDKREDESALLLKDFNLMAQSLERLERERRYGLAAIAHELRTPVTVLRGRLEGVRDGVLPADTAELEKLIGHADLLTKLIEDLQLLSLAEAGELRLEKRDFVIQDLLTRVHTDFMSKAETKAIKLSLQMPSEHIRINADQQRLYQVLSNILGNALRHTPDTGTIEIRCLKNLKTVSIEIADSGAGFSPTTAARAFDRFYRSADRARQNGGSGLGLSISKSLIEAHHGTIELLPVKKGACLRITMPQKTNPN